MKKLFLIFVLVLLSQVAFGTDYYVCGDSDCSDCQAGGSGWCTSDMPSDSNAGTKASPWITPQKAEDTMTGGDTAWIGNGTITRSGSNTAIISLNNTNGSSGAHIVFRAENNYGVVLDGEEDENYIIVIFNEVDYVDFIGLDLYNAATAGVWANNGTGLDSHHITFTNCIIRNNGPPSTIDDYGYSGIYTNHNTHHYTVDKCVIHDNGRKACPSGDHCYRHDHGWYAQGSNHVLTNSILYNHNRGWHLKIDGYTGAVMGEGEYSHYVINNTFAGTTYYGGAIRFFDNGYEDPCPYVANNISYDNDGVQFDTFIHVTNASGGWPWNECAELTVVKNNVGSETYSYDEWQGTAVTNYITAAYNTKGLPLVSFYMTDPGSKDFTLTENSSYLINQGETTFSPVDDFLSVIRDEYPDIGAYEYTGEDTTPPELNSTTIASNGTSLTLAFSESVTQGSGYNNSDWDIDCSSGGNNISITYSSGNSTSSHVYTISQTIYSGDTCNIDFNGDTDSEEDSAGNDLAAIVSDSVTNNSTQFTPTAAGVTFSMVIP